MKKIIYSLLLTLILFSCQKDEKYEHPYSFYYWKSTLDFTQEEKDVLETSSGDYLYVRMFDVDKINGKFEPVGSASKKEGFVTDKKIVPVVFITNRTFLNITPQEIEFLAKNIHRMIDNKIKAYGFNTIQEIQIDCDWTAGTKDDYFKFLELLKKISKKQVTSTLRLHQVKFREKSGIPPVDKIYLMCYSTSSPLDNSDKNSILDVETLKTYLDDINQYPIQDITVALPIYSWGIIENHLGKHKLINGLSIQDLDRPEFKRITNTEAEVLEDGFYFGFYLNEGFKIKVEEVSHQDIQKVVHFLESKIGSFPLVYYQLDDKFVMNRDLSL